MVDEKSVTPLRGVTRPGVDGGKKGVTKTQKKALQMQGFQVTRSTRRIS